MPRKKKDDTQQKAGVESGSQNREQKAAKQTDQQQSDDQKMQTQKVAVTTTEGNTIDKIRIFQKEGATMVQADYGRLNPDGKTPEERRANMRTQLARQLTPEQAQEYQRLYADDSAKAKEFAVQSVYPMHVDDAAFHQKDTVINDRKVNYITIEKITEDTLLLNALYKEGVNVDRMNREQRTAAIAAMSPDTKQKVLDSAKGLLDKWQLAFGEKGNPDSRFYGIMNHEELASFRHRAEVTLGREEVKDKNGNTVRDKRGNPETREVIKSVGAPLTMADIAGRVEQRVLARHQDNEAKLEAAKKVDWSKFKLPSAANITGLRYTPSKEHPDRVWLNGKVNGIEVFGLLSKNETIAAKNKVATLEQVAAANKGFREKVLDIVGPQQKQAVSEEVAVKAIVDRASDSSARSFTTEQVNTLNGYAASASTPEERTQVFASLWEKAQPQLIEAGVNEAWQADAREELQDLGEGIVRGEQQAMKR